MPISLLREGGALPAESQAPAPASHQRIAIPVHEATREEPSAFARVLSDLGRAAGKGESSVTTAIDASKRGADLSATELLALQAGVYRYSEAVDLASKLVDRATSSVKTVIQGQ